VGKTWGPFTGRQLTAIVISVIVGVVLLPGAVWAVDSFTNVAIQDPVSGAKASVDAKHHVLVGDGSGSLSVDGTVNTLPSTSKNPFLSQGSVSNYYSNGSVYVAISNPTSATLVVNHLTLSNSIYNANPWEVYFYQAAGTTTAQCVSNTFASASRRLGVRNVAAGSTLIEDFTTPLVLKPVSGSTSWCLVGGGGPRTSDTQSANAYPLAVQYGGFVVSGSFTPSTPATAAPSPSPAPKGAKPTLGQ